MVCLLAHRSAFRPPFMKTLEVIAKEKKVSLVREAAEKYIRITGFSIPVDLIPFRGVASAGATVAWPPNEDVVMNVAGFEEVLESSIFVEIEKGLTVRVASVPGQPCSS